MALRLVAVYDTDADARRAVRALEAAGVSATGVRINDRRDQLDATEGEMRTEVMHDPAPGWRIGVVVGAVIGVVIALPFAAFHFGGFNVWARLVTVAVVGAIAGSTAGWLLGAAFSARRPDEPLAAEAGVTLSIVSSRSARNALVATHPRRIDMVSDDGHVVGVFGDEAHDAQQVVRDIGRHMGSERRHG